MTAGGRGEPKVERRMIRTRRGMRKYTYLGCPLTKNRTAWCFRLCVPDPSGKGRCGRVAPHGLTGRTQAAIAGHRRTRRAAHCTQLERAYLAMPVNALCDPGVRVDHGEAVLVVPVGEAVRLPAGGLSDAACLKIMHDAAQLAASAIEEGRLVTTQRFTAQLSRHDAHGEIVARGLVVEHGDGRYVAQCVLTDGAGAEIGRGEGTFERGRPLAPEGDGRA